MPNNAQGSYQLAIQFTLQSNSCLVLYSILSSYLKTLPSLDSDVSHELYFSQYVVDITVFPSPYSSCFSKLTKHFPCPLPSDIDDTDYTAGSGRGDVQGDYGIDSLFIYQPHFCYFHHPLLFPSCTFFLHFYAKLFTPSW